MFLPLLKDQELSGIAKLFDDTIRYDGFQVLMLLQNILEGGNLGAVFAFVAVVHVDEDVVERVGRAVPGKDASLAQLCGGNAGNEEHDLRVGIVELRQHVPDTVVFAPVYLAVIELRTLFNESVQSRRRATGGK